jgi:hypothetical protein
LFPEVEKKSSTEITQVNNTFGTHNLKTFILLKLRLILQKYLEIEIQNIKEEKKVDKKKVIQEFSDLKIIYENYKNIEFSKRIDDILDIKKLIDFDINRKEVENIANEYKLESYSLYSILNLFITIKNENLSFNKEKLNEELKNNEKKFNEELKNNEKKFNEELKYKDKEFNEVLNKMEYETKSLNEELKNKDIKFNEELKNKDIKIKELIEKLNTKK